MNNNKSSARKGLKDNNTTNNNNAPQESRQIKKLSEYGKQLYEKQRVKRMYGMREKQFKNFFKLAKKNKDATGSALLVLLERRLDNIVFRMKFATTRKQARQMVVHGHFLVNGKKVYSPSCLIKANDAITLCEASKVQEGFMKQVIEKGFAASIKVPEWIEFDKNTIVGKVLRLPVREDIQASINESFIVELYSK
jgi:small subunit ribosomal protein S4